jgi:hypothetical protein
MVELPRPPVGAVLGVRITMDESVTIASVVALEMSAKAEDTIAVADSVG